MSKSERGTIYVSFVDTGSGFSRPTPILASHKKKGMVSATVTEANDNHVQRIGIVNREMVYIPYKNADVNIVEVKVME